MAQQIQTLFIDDIDGGAAEGTVRFGLDGSNYEIDLSGKHGVELHEALAKYIEHSRKVRVTAKHAPLGSRRTVSAVDSTAVRAWAKDRGMGIKDRGRVPASVVEQYRAAIGS